MKEFTITSLPKFTFRIRKMNGIEALAARQVILQIKEGKLEEAYYMMLEKYIDVQVDKDVWQRCKEGRDIYPAGLEDNVEALSELMSKWMEYIADFFTKSNA